MKKLLLLLLAACGAHAAAPAPAAVHNTTPPPKPPDIDEKLIASDAALEHPFFYEATKDGHTAHFLGTVHVGIDPARLPKKVWDTLAASKIFAMETDIDDQSMMMQLLRNDGSTLDQELGPKYWAKYQQVVGAALAKQLLHFKTSVAASVLDVKQVPMTPPMDSALKKKATDGGLKIEFFEKPEFQLALLDKWLDAKALETELDHMDDDATSTKEMLTAYARGDESVLSDETMDEKEWLASGRSDAEYQQMNHEMLLDRNAAWVPQIEQMAAEGDLFVAVGAAHLMGDAGVLGLLKKRGWTVQRIAP
jgi:uncharacterized protein YbaP (TraB family)